MLNLGLAMSRITLIGMNVQWCCGAVQRWLSPECSVRDHTIREYERLTAVRRQSVRLRPTGLGWNRGKGNP